MDLQTTQDISITLIQTDLVWEDALANQKKLSALIDKTETTDLIILPETFSTGFSMNSKKLAEPMNGVTIQWMQNEAKKANTVICGSLILEESGKYYNRFIWMRPDGTFEKYDKRHLFRMANENEHYSGGETKLVVELKGWKICPLVCYDLRFPVWSRNKTATNPKTAVEWEYDLLIYIASWPKARVSAWEKLLYARAIENQSYVAGVNRIGLDGNAITYSGSTMLIDPKGDCIWKAKEDQESISTHTVSFSELNEFRKRFPVGMDADGFDIK